MQRRWILGATAVLVLLAAVWWRWSGSSGPSSAETLADADAPSAALAARRAARRAGRVDTSPARLAGRVVDARSDAGVPGAIVSLRLRRLDGGATAAPGDSPAPITATTDASGQFVAERLPPGRYTVSASADGYRPALTGPLDLAGGADEDGVVLRLEPGGHRLTGRVTDIGGGPVAGAFVQATDVSDVSVSTFFRAPFTAVTDADGHYALALDEGRYSVHVFHPDYVRDDEMVRMERGDRTLDFVLAPGATIEGVVLRRGDDEPVAGATVSQNSLGDTGGFTISGVSFTGSATTDDAGRFTLTGLASGAIELRAVGRGVASAEPAIVDLGIAETVTDVILYVDPAYTVSGFVVDADDEEEAVPGVLVGAFNVSPGAVYVATDPSADDGYFEILGVRSGSYTVGLMAEGRVSNPFGDSVTVADADVDDVVLKVNAGAALSGRVEPPTEARLALSVPTENIGLGNLPQVIGAALVNARAAADGTFTVEGVADGSYQLTATTSDGSEGSLEVTVSGADQNDLVVKLEDRARIAGVVVDEAGQPVEGLQIRVAGDTKPSNVSFSLNGSGMGGDALTGPDGSFEAVGLEDGSYEVSVQESWSEQLAWADESGDARLEPKTITIADGRDVTGLRFVIESQSHAITGLVRGPDGAPLPDAWVTATFLPGKTRGRSEDDEDDEDGKRHKVSYYAAEKPVLTDGDGRFRVENLREGLYELEAEGLRGGARGSAEEVRTGSSVTIRLEGLGGVTGVVTRGGQPVTSYVVHASGDGGGRRMQVANPEGRYRLTRLDPGDYQLSVTSPSGRSQADVTIASSEIQERDLSLIAYGSVSGVAVDARTGEPLADYPVFAHIEGDDSALGEAMFNVVKGDGPRTDEEGRFRVGRLGSGKGQLWLMDDRNQGFTPIVTHSFELPPGEDLDLGTLRGAAPETIPEEERGTLGFDTTRATWSSRPGAGDDGDDPPAGIDADAEHLWVASVAPGGPAERAGLEVGDRITAIDEVPVAQIGPQIAAALLGPGRRRVGDAVTLAVDRAGSPTTVAITATPVTD